MQLGSTVPAQPDTYSGGIDPEEGGYFSGHFYGIVTLQSLQSLHIEQAVVEITFSPIVPVDALTFKKELPFHKGWPSSRAAPREPSIQMLKELFVGYELLRRLQGGRTEKGENLLTPPAHNATLAIRGQSSLFHVQPT